MGKRPVIILGDYTINTDKTIKDNGLDIVIRVRNQINRLFNGIAFLDIAKYH